MEVLEILKYTLPALIVFFTTFVIMHQMIKKEQAREKLELVLQNQKTITPIRLQAYERLTLFMERITPDSLIMRVNKPGMTCAQLHQELLQVIRAEYEHNMSQQVYITSKAWEVVKNARSGVVKLVNTSAEKFKPDEPAIKLSKLILERTMEVVEHPTQVAIKYLKSELSEIF